MSDRIRSHSGDARSQCRLIRHFSSVCLLTLSAMLCCPVNAEFFGLPSGRLATISGQSAVSVEVGYSKGEIDKADYSQRGLRINYRLADNLMLYGDLGQSEVGRSDDNTLGVGAFFELKNVFDFAQSIALKGAVHQFELDRSSTSGGCVSGTQLMTNPYDGTLTLNPTLSCSSSTSDYKVKGRSISLELLTSGNPVEQLTFNGVTPSWYANAGVHTFNNIKIDTSIGLGGGLIYPLARSQLYLGADFIDELVFGLGIRYQVR